MLNLGDARGHRWRSSPRYGTPCSFGEHFVGAPFVLEDKLAGPLAIQVNPRRAWPQRRPAFRALGVLFQQTLDPVPAHLRMLADNLFAYADLERLAIRAAEATRVWLGEQVHALVHSGILARCWA
jgi:hypothetical protein